MARCLRRADILWYLMACRKRHALQERLKAGIKNQRRRPSLIHYYLLLLTFGIHPDKPEFVILL